MTRNRSLRTQRTTGRQRAWLVVLLCCFLVQALTPRGYMPTASSDGFPTLGFCGDPIPGAEQLFDFDDFPQAGTDQPETSHEQNHCVFSVVAQVAAIPAVLSAPASPRSSPLPQLADVLSASGRRGYQLPDTRAPPVLTV